MLNQSPCRSLLALGVLTIALGLFMSSLGSEAPRAGGTMRRDFLATPPIEARHTVEAASLFRAEALATGAVLVVFSFLLGAASVSWMTREWLGAMTGVFGMLVPLSLSRTLKGAAAPPQIACGMFLFCLIAIFLLYLFRGRRRVVLPTDKPE